MDGGSDDARPLHPVGSVSERERHLLGVGRHAAPDPRGEHTDVNADRDGDPNGHRDTDSHTDGVSHVDGHRDANGHDDRGTGSHHHADQSSVTIAADYVTVFATQFWTFRAGVGLAKDRPRRICQGPTSGKNAGIIGSLFEIVDTTEPADDSTVCTDAGGAFGRVGVPVGDDSNSRSREVDRSL